MSLMVEGGMNSHLAYRFEDNEIAFVENEQGASQRKKGLLVRPKGLRSATITVVHWWAVFGPA